MRVLVGGLVVLGLAGVLALLLAVPGETRAARAGGAAAADTLAERIFLARCADCHGEVAEYAPSRHALAARPRSAIVDALTTGSMRDMAAGLSESEILALAGYLGAPGVTALGSPEGAFCSTPAPPLTLEGAAWNGWGVDHDHTRYQPDPGIRADELPRLQVKWAFGHPGGGVVSQPTVVGGRVFVSGREVHALDAESGCIYWSHEVGGRGSRTAISVGPMPPSSPARFAAYVADLSSQVHALDAETGELLWSTRVSDHRAAQLTGAPALHDGRLFIPISSGEESRAAGPGYECCTFRGGIVALDAHTGEELWRAYTIEEEPRPFRVNRDGVQMYGPAGAAIWSSPTLDLRRNAIYGVTGNSYTEVAEPGSAAILAFDLGTGAWRWGNQVTEDDNYVVGCFGPSEGRAEPHANCPEDLGPDWDFGASPILRSLPGGGQVLIAGQKSGVVYGLDPDDGRKLWQARIGVGGPLGGIQWGMAADDEHVYVAVSDEGHYNFRSEDPRPGLSKLRIDTGEVVWSVPAPPRDCAWALVDRPDAMYVPGGCSRAMSAPLTLIPGAVLVPSVDGNLRAFAVDDGSVFWTFNTARDYATVNGVPAKGGSLNATGAVVAGGHLYLNSGYSGFGGEPGNVLLAFSVDGR
jgi:polyvinyl alcohol dehydrogenase (cytochrome)